MASFLAQLDSTPSIAGGDELMSDCKEEGDESRIIDEVEEGMREFVLQSKRRKLVKKLVKKLYSSMTEPQSKYSAYWEASFGHSMFDIKNRTHAHCAWHRIYQ